MMQAALHEAATVAGGVEEANRIHFEKGVPGPEKECNSQGFSMLLHILFPLPLVMVVS